MDDNGLIHNEWFGRTVIYSDVRYTYEQAQNIIEGKKDQNSSTILKINDIAKIIRKKRIENGALNIESQEVKFKLDEQLKPHLFEQACAKVGQKLNLRLQDSYDHSYFFIQSFINDHLRHHADILKA